MLKPLRNGKETHRGVRLHAPQSHVIFDAVTIYIFARRPQSRADTKNRIQKHPVKRSNRNCRYLTKPTNMVVSLTKHELLLQDLPRKQIEVVSNIS